MSDDIIRSNNNFIKFKPNLEEQKVSPKNTQDIRENNNPIKIEDDSKENLKKLVLECIQDLEITMLRGPQGVQGEMGPTGPGGPTGGRGARGATGATGKDGHDGIDGNNGATGAPGKNGRNGYDGKDGADGINGRNGADGTRGPHGHPGMNGATGPPGPPCICSGEKSSKTKIKSTIYVDPKYGSDSKGEVENLSKPFRTIEEAIKNSKSDECIILAPGNYGTLIVKPSLWIEAQHGLVIFDQIITSDKYKWKDKDAVYLSGISIRANDRPAVVMEKGSIFINDSNICSYYGHNTKNDAYLLNLQNCKLNISLSNLFLESYGNNETVASIYATGSGTEVLIDNSHFNIKRDGADSNIYISYNDVKNGKIDVTRSHFKIDDDNNNNVQVEYVSENAGIASAFKSNVVSHKTNPSHAITKVNLETKSAPKSSGNSNSTRIIKSDTLLSPTDNFIVITAEQKTQITLPTLTGSKFRDLQGSVDSIVYQFKTTKEFVTHTINTGDNNRINEFDKQIIIDNSKIWNFRSVGDEWIAY